VYGSGNRNITFDRRPGRKKTDDRRVAICSAKTPVYAFVASQIFGVDAFCVLSMIYLASVALPLLYSFILYKTVIGEKPRPIATEIAEFRKPDVFTAFKSLLKTLGRFIIKLGTVVMLSSVAFYILGAVSPDLRFLRIDEADDSVLAVIGRALSFLLLPIGIKDWRYTAAIVGGVFAKESVVSTLAKLFPHGLMLGAASGVGFVVFVYLYTPCVTALAAIRRRAGLKRMLLTAFGQLLYAVVFSHFAYLAVSLFL
jgi:ferrous iron transport protein B